MTGQQQPATYADQTCTLCRGTGTTCDVGVDGRAIDVACSCLRPVGDAIHRSKQILELVDLYTENQNQWTRNLLRVTLLESFQELLLKIKALSTPAEPELNRKHPAPNASVPMVPTAPIRTIKIGGDHDHPRSYELGGRWSRWGKQ